MTTQLITTEKRPDNVSSITSQYIRDGKAGSFQAVAQMVRIVRRSAQDAEIQKFVVNQILKPANLSSNSDPESILKAVFDFVNDKQVVEYVSDMAGEIESIKDLRTTLLDAYGDCDDLAILTATLLASIGLEPYFVLAKFDDSPDSPFSHIYVVVYANNNRFVFDPVIPNGRFNEEIEPLAKQEIGVFDTHNGIDSFGAIAAHTITALKHGMHDAANTAKKVIPLASRFVPGLGPAVAFSGFIPEKEKHNYLDFQQAAKEINKDINACIEQLSRNQISASQAKTLTAKIQQAINNVSADTLNEKIIRDSIQRRLDLINSYKGDGVGELSHETALMITLGLTGLALTYPIWSKWVKKYI